MMLPSDDQLLSIFESTQTIAVVGASGDEQKQAHKIPAYLQSQGYRVIPVNPDARGAILGEPAVDSLGGIGEPVDVVDVFRPAAEAPGIAHQAAGIGARVLWLQLGIESEEAAQIGRDAGMVVVMGACMGAVHRKLVREGRLSSGGG